jgi:hypothetical protein
MAGVTFTVDTRRIDCYIGITQPQRRLGMTIKTELLPAEHELLCKVIDHTIDRIENDCGPMFDQAMLRLIRAKLNFRSEEQLTQEYDAWLKVHPQYTPMSADELVTELCDEAREFRSVERNADIDWLIAFMDRWEQMARHW